jgi:UDP-N-acetyl-D-galactosamine dehydrogenase
LGVTKIAVVGLGYVGLPLAIEFGKTLPTLGFDVNTKRIAQLTNCNDTNKESSSGEINQAKFLKFTSDPKALRRANFIIVAVPTPVTSSKQPDLSFVEAASRTVGRNMQKGSIVVFEPTVYPGVTEEICVPILEKESGLKYKKDFKVGYSPERIVPGDKEKTLVKIVKIVAGCDAGSLNIIADTYGRIIEAGVYRAANIKTAEAAKVIENTQRDLNIALANELALIFHRMGIDSRAVIDAAGTKWNFHKYYPGLVGGHCIGVDPYYLTYKAEELGYHPQVILSGRRINDYMGHYVATQTMKHLITGGKTVKGAKVMVMGITFKENVSDIRNSRVIDLIRELKVYGMDVKVCDPHADPEEVHHEYGVTLIPYKKTAKLDAIVVAVNHSDFKKLLTAEAFRKHLSNGSSQGVVIDVKGMFCAKDFDGSNLLYWRL